jgi:hypothetical protein
MTQPLLPEQILSKRKQAEKDRVVKKTNAIKDPVKCPVCSQTIMVPQNRDVDEYVTTKIKKCINDTSAPCYSVISSGKNKEIALKLLNGKTQ